MWTSRLVSRRSVFRNRLFPQELWSTKPARQAKWQHPSYATQAPRSSRSSRIREAIIKARNENPVLFPIGLVGCIASLSLLGLLAYDEYTRVAPAYAAYPTPVEQRLRMALHYTHIDPDPESASKYFREAIEVAEAAGMNPLSTESLGIRIRYAECLEKFGRVKASIEVLSNITKDLEQGLQDLDQLKTDELALQRQALLKGIIQNKVKMSSLYDSDYIQDPRASKQVMSDAIALLVKETKDPQTSGFSENNAAGLSLAEIAAMLSQMGDLYATSGEEANAVQVYMLALPPLRAACNGSRSCKEVQVLSNIAATMDQALKKPNAKINGKPATKELVATARKGILKWADQAIATAERVKPEDRDDICELGMLSAQMTKADLLLDSGQKVQSKELFRSMLPTLRERGLMTLAQVAEQGMRRADT